MKTNTLKINSDMKEALNNLQKEIENYVSISNMATNKSSKLFDALKLFFDSYINYCDSYIKTKKYDTKTLCGWICKDKSKIQNGQISKLIEINLFISKEYVEYLNTRISINNIDRYKYVILNLIDDLGGLINDNEINKGILPTSPLFVFRNHYLPTIELFVAARNLFYIEECNNFEGLSDLKPLVMFQIRQLIEIYGKSQLGFSSIKKDGKEVPKHSQEPWKFFANHLKQADVINIHFDKNAIKTILNWTNKYIHTTYLYPDYIQFFIIKIVGDLIFTPIEFVNKADIKNRFEQYVKDKETRKNNTEEENSIEKASITIEWL